MNEFKAALDSYLDGRAELAQLDACLNDALLKDPSAAPAAEAEIVRLRSSGRLSRAACSLLRHSIANSDTRNGQTEASNGDRSQAVAIDAGTILKDRFVLEEVVGRGGMGIVFRARDMRKEEADDRNPYVAIKVLNEEFGRHPEALRTLQRETRKSQSLAHPNIVTVYDFDRDGDTVYMTMEFLEGRPLDRTTKDDAFAGIPIAEAFPMIEGLCRALSYAHAKGVVHSDFKPGNCFVTRDGTVKVFDFGIARAGKLPGDQPDDATRLDATRFDAGQLGALTPAYASFEMLQRAEPDPRDDIYGLGCVTYELLTGRHPFDMHSAVEARANRLVPARIRGLKSGQWKVLKQALAFERDQRCPTVETLLNGLGAGMRSKTALASAVAAAVVLTASAAVLIPEFLQQREVDALVTALSSGQEERINAALKQFDELDSTTQATVMAEADESLLGYYVGRIDAAVDSSLGQYDYPAAEETLNQARKYFSDSASLQARATRLENDKQSLIADLETRYAANLKAGRLLLGPEDSAVEVVGILAAADPGNDLLADPALATAFTTEATRALDANNLARAERLTEAGLARFREDPQTVAALMQLQQRLENASRSDNVGNRIVELRSMLAGVENIDTLTELRALGPTATTLDSLFRDDALVATYRERLTSVADYELTPLLTTRRFADAEALIASISTFVTNDQLRERQQRLADARSRYEGEQGQLLSTLEGAVDEGRLEDATRSLEQLRELGPGSDTVAMAGAKIELGYVHTALDQRAEGDLNGASETVRMGLEFAPGSEWLESVAASIAEDRRLLESGNESSAAARQTQIEFYQEEISRQLSQPQLEIEVARQAIDNMRRLANLAPGDPLARTGRSMTAEKLANRATALTNEGRWDDGAAFASQAVSLVPESALLRTLNAEISAGRDRYVAERRQQQAEALRTTIGGLLASPTLDAAWDEELRTALSALDSLATEHDTFANDARLSAAESYLQAAIADRHEQRFAEANQKLLRARSLAPQLDSIAAEQTALADAERTAKEESDAQARLAHLEALRRRVLNAANDGDWATARTALNELTRSLPADDPFVRTTAPDAIGAAYVRFAEQRFHSNDFAGAQSIAMQGLEELERMDRSASPAAISLYALADEIPPARLAFNLQTIEVLLSSEPPTDSSLPRSLLDTIELDAGEEAFAVYQADLIAIVEQRIETASDPDAIRSWAQAIFDREFLAPLDNSGYQCMTGLAGKGLGKNGRDGEVCWDVVDARDRVRGPTLVVIPDGGFIPVPFAISKYESSIGEWNAYCRRSGDCQERSGREDLPVTQVRLAEARRYASWLSTQTSAVYRLPSSAEWEYAASAPRSLHDDNCGVRGASPRTVTEGRANDWGLINYVGNVREWVTTPLGPEVRGGSYRGSLARCTHEHVEQHVGDGDDETGFRLVREL